MRSSTFVVSFVVHALFIAIVVVVPLVATDALPQLRRSITFVTVTPDIPTLPPPRAPRSTPPAPSRTNPAAAPVVEPLAIVDEPAVTPVEAPIADGIITGALDITGTAIGPVSIAPPPPSPPAPTAPVRVGGAIRPPQRVEHVAPEYPAIARSARVSGIVILEAVLAEDGAVRDVKLLRSVPLLDQAAIDAVRQWRFTPTLLNGVPVPVIMTVTVAFNLN